MFLQRPSTKIATLVATGLVIASLLAGMGVVGASTSPAHANIGASYRPSALIQPADSKTACISGGPGASLRQAERAARLTYHCIETFSDEAPTWAIWVRPWITSPIMGYRSWLSSDPEGRTIILTQNLIPYSEADNPDWRAEGAAGDFNKYARLFAENLIRSGFAYSVIRLGHEMNGRWEDDNIGHTRVQWKHWAEYFAQIVRSMRSVPGAHFLFDWNVNAGTWTTIRLADYYPGNAYVDIVGLSFYDQSGARLPPVGSSSRWSVLANEPLGLNTVYAFAAQHHKPLSLPEWGTVSTQGDDGNYVAHIGDFVATHDVAYQSWFDAGDDHIYQLNPAEAPHSVAAYVQTISLRIR